VSGNKIIVSLLVVLNITLIIICGYFYLQKDRQEPTISFSANEIVYTPGMDQELLMDGISALDNVDGNISNRIVIEKILENEANNTAVVYYAVCDYSGNVYKASREFQAEYPKQDIEEEE